MNNFSVGPPRASAKHMIFALNLLLKSENPEEADSTSDRAGDRIARAPLPQKNS